MTDVLAIGSQKGGIGKTTTTANLAVAWGESGARVLAIDLDPQFALTRRFGISPGDAPATVFELLAGEGEVGDAVVRDIAPGVDLLAARRELAKLELSLASEHHRERFLADLLSGQVEPFDFVLIDCLPSLGLLTVNAFVGRQWRHCAGGHDRRGRAPSSRRGAGDRQGGSPEPTTSPCGR